MDRLLDTSALTKAQKTDLVSYRNQLNPASITRRIIDLQNVLIRLAKDKTDQLRGESTTKAGPLLRSAIRIRKAGDEAEAKPGVLRGPSPSPTAGRPSKKSSPGL